MLQLMNDGQLMDKSQICNIFIIKYYLSLLFFCINFLLLLLNGMHLMQNYLCV